ncbi:hypothetical protein A3A63_00055 [Candidatus Gottesmanbacteria bacterium RIFCSPLOWO2_01_FULL_46_9]|uniref:Cell division protein FtsL n=1 Tax=Candidatus Gottesmanbacteria bacterium RIFCSPLOWO2_01_FULL_46_9 TaxID=1798394 RepID=A0A1F6B3V3_9BACT|nr:MAG: hypothetical protein A3A63_00055 [Candidatus Gottesmanbacteria bacterium RIFCSPLOWO2_01_FULL_46_9]
MKRIRNVFVRVLPVLAVSLAVIEIILANQLAGSGKAVRSVDLTVDVLRQENELLTQRVASASSLITIFSRAKEIGFIEPAKSQYLTIVPEQLPVAFNNPQ